MNEKLRNHINILFAAAPKNRKAEELKEELLTNLNDKYDDLLKSGYDSTSAFHIALSGIGDIDELFRECRESAESSGPVQNGRTTNSQTTVGQNEKPGASNDSATPVPKTTSSGCLLTPLLLAIAIGLFVLGPGLVVFFSDLSGIDVSPRNVRVNGIHVSPGHVKIESLNRLNDIRIGVMMMFASWAAGIGLIVYLIVRAVKNSYCDREKPHACSRPNSGTTPFSQTQTMDNVTAVSGEITNKRIIAGILAIVFGALGVHKFFLGYTTAGLVMLLATVLSVFLLSPITGGIAFIEGILYLAKNDQDFYRDYVQGKRPWF